MKKTLLLYLPVLHEGYLKLFKRHASADTDLAILGPDIIIDFPELAREVRAMPHETVKSLVESLGIFPEVRIITKKDLKSLDGQELIVADESIMEELAKKYFKKSKIAKDHAFLRWDTKNVQSVLSVSPDITISKKKFDHDVLRLAEKEAQKSADWYRQVGAAIVRDGKVILVGYNTRQPTPHAAYIEADPRNFLPPGSDTNLRLTVHAEQRIVAEAAKQGIALEGAAIYVTTFPCPDCAGVIAYTGIKKCYYAGGYSSLDGEKILKKHGVELIFVK